MSHVPHKLAAHSVASGWIEGWREGGQEGGREGRREGMKEGAGQRERENLQRSNKVLTRRSMLCASFGKISTMCAKDSLPCVGVGQASIRTKQNTPKQKNKRHLWVHVSKMRACCINNTHSHTYSCTHKYFLLPRHMRSDYHTPYYEHPLQDH